MGTVIPFPVERMAESPLTKRRLAKALGRSTRWVELRVREGAPHERLPNGELRFRLTPFLRFLDERGT